MSVNCGGGLVTIKGIGIKQASYEATGKTNDTYP